jgi:peptidoglycan/xylan/chitin deacetylase (PgdA/CDA1 family)
MYHDVIQNGEDKSSSGLDIEGAEEYKIDAGIFEAQVKFAAETMDATSKELVFTFDDGGKSAITTIAPILEKYHFKGMFFIPTAFIGKQGFVDRNDILELYKGGHTIGSHSHAHLAKINRMSYEGMLNEWKQSCELLREIIQTPVKTASVPGGWYSPDVASAAFEAGITNLYISKPVEETYQVSQYEVHGRFAIRESTGLQTFKNLLMDRGFVRDAMLLRWRIGEVVKLFY